LGEEDDPATGRKKTPPCQHSGSSPVPDPTPPEENPKKEETAQALFGRRRLKNTKPTRLSNRQLSTVFRTSLTHFDPVAFLESPGFTLTEVTLSGEKWLLVHPD
jgi:hypothetical protein